MIGMIKVLATYHTLFSTGVIFLLTQHDGCLTVFIALFLNTSTHDFNVVIQVLL